MSYSHQHQDPSKYFSNFQQGGLSSPITYDRPQEIPDIPEPIFYTRKTANTNAGANANFSSNSTTYNGRQSNRISTSIVPIISKSTLNQNQKVYAPTDPNFEEQKFSVLAGTPGYGELAQDNRVVNQVYTEEQAQAYSEKPITQDHSETKGYNIQTQSYEIEEPDYQKIQTQRYGSQAQTYGTETRDYKAEVKGYDDETQTQRYGETQIQKYDDYLPMPEKNLEIPERYMQQDIEDDKTATQGYISNEQGQVFSQEQSQTYANVEQERKFATQTYPAQSENHRNVDIGLVARSQDYTDKTQKQVIRENKALTQGYVNAPQEYVIEQNYSKAKIKELPTSVQAVRELAANQNNRAFVQEHGPETQGYMAENIEQRYTNLAQKYETTHQDYETQAQTYENLAQNYGAENENSELDEGYENIPPQEYGIETQYTEAKDNRAITQGYETIPQNYKNSIQEYATTTENQGYWGETQQYTPQVQDNTTVAKKYDFSQGYDVAGTPENTAKTKNSGTEQQTLNIVERGYASVPQKNLIKNKQRTSKQRYVNIPQEYSTETQDYGEVTGEQYDFSNDVKYKVQNYAQPTTSGYEQFGDTTSSVYGVSEGATAIQSYGINQSPGISSKHVPQAISQQITKPILQQAPRQVPQPATQPIPHQVTSQSTQQVPRQASVRKPSSRVISSVTYPLKSAPTNSDVYAFYQLPEVTPSQVPQPVAPQSLVPQHSERSFRYISSDTVPFETVQQNVNVYTANQFQKSLPKVPQRQVPNAVPQPQTQPSAAQQTSQKVRRYNTKGIPQTFSEILTDYPKVDLSYKPRIYPTKTTRTRPQPEQYFEESSFRPLIRNFSEGDIDTTKAQQRSLQKSPLPEKRYPQFERTNYNKNHQALNSTQARWNTLKPINQRPIVARPLQLEPVVRPTKYETRTIKYDRELNEELLPPKYTRSTIMDENIANYNFERNTNQLLSTSEKRFDDTQLQHQYRQEQYQPMEHERSVRVPVQQVNKSYDERFQFNAPKLQTYANEENKTQNEFTKVVPKEDGQVLQQAQTTIPYCGIGKIDITVTIPFSNSPVSVSQNDQKSHSTSKTNDLYGTSNFTPKKITVDAPNYKLPFSQEQKINEQQYTQEYQAREDVYNHQEIQGDVSYGKKITIPPQKQQYPQETQRAAPYSEKTPKGASNPQLNKEEQKFVSYGKTSTITQKQYQEANTNTQEQQYAQQQQEYIQQQHHAQKQEHYAQQYTQQQYDQQQGDEDLNVPNVIFNKDGSIKGVSFGRKPGVEGYERPSQNDQ